MSLEASILEFVKKVDTTRDQSFIAGQNPNLSTYKDWYNGQNVWHNRKQLKGNETVDVQIEASGTPKLIAEDWASNYANEDTAITVTTPEELEESAKEEADSTKENEKKEESQNDIVNKILKKNGFFGKFNSFAEKFNALGCGATVVVPSNFYFENNVIKKQKDTRVKIKFLDAERVIPITTEDDEVIECAFVRVTTQKAMLQIHILINGKYTIAEVEGKRTADKSNNVDNIQFDYSQAKIINTDSDVPLFQVWHPNLANDSNMLESIYSQAIGWFKLVDTIFDCWYKEFKRGAKKRYISTEMQQIGADGKKMDMSDVLEDEDIVIPPSVDGKPMISEFNAELRVDPIIKSLVSAMNIAARLCGLGDSAFEIGEGGGRPIQTATAAIIKESKLYKNIIKQENFATTQIKKLLLAIKTVYNTYCESDQALTFEEDDIQVVYDDNIMEDTQQKKDNQLKEVSAGIMSIAEYRANWYDEDYDSAVKFVQDNGLLLDKYTLALQSHVITPEMFVDFVFGENYKHKSELIAYIDKKNKEAQSQFMPFNDEKDEEDEDKDNEDEENKSKEDSSEDGDGADA